MKHKFSKVKEPLEIGGENFHYSVEAEYLVCSCGFKSERLTSWWPGAILAEKFVQLQHILSAEGIGELV